MRELRLIKANLTVRPVPGGFDVDDGLDRIRIVAAARAVRYRYGVARFLGKVARQYGVPRYASIRPGDIVLDLGANIGEFSLYAARRGAQVFAVEPDPSVIDLLRHNVAGRPVTVLPVAVWNRDEPVTFNLAADDADSSIIGNGSARAVSVRGCRLDTLVPELGLERIRLIKCDAEGGEPEVLLGARETLQRTEFITLDCGYERSGERTLETCAGILRDGGFEIRRYQETGRCNLVARNRSFAA
jgi:FkbM family methyltransferase